MVQKRVNLGDAAMKTFWSPTRFNLSLDQCLVSALEDEARWLVKNNLTTEKVTPDFLNNIYVDGIKAVKPNAVNIFASNN